MYESIMFQCNINPLLRIVDVFGYGDLSSFNYKIAKSSCLLFACDIIEKAKKLGAMEIAEDRMKLKPRNNQFAISFSLIFKDNDSLEAFLKFFFTG